MSSRAEVTAKFAKAYVKATKAGASPGGLTVNALDQFGQNKFTCRADRKVFGDMRNEPVKVSGETVCAEFGPQVPFGQCGSPAGGPIWTEGGDDHIRIDVQLVKGNPQVENVATLRPWYRSDLGCDQLWWLKGLDVSVSSPPGRLHLLRNACEIEGPAPPARACAVVPMMRRVAVPTRTLAAAPRAGASSSPYTGPGAPRRAADGQRRRWAGRSRRGVHNVDRPA
jgi:hypothetical protein